MRRLNITVTDLSRDGSRGLVTSRSSCKWAGDAISVFLRFVDSSDWLPPAATHSAGDSYVLGGGRGSSIAVGARRGRHHTCNGMLRWVLQTVRIADGCRSFSTIRQVSCSLGRFQTHCFPQLCGSSVTLLYGCCASKTLFGPLLTHTDTYREPEHLPQPR